VRSAASFLSAAARVDPAPAHLSVQSAFPSLAHQPIRYCHGRIASQA